MRRSLRLPFCNGRVLTRLPLLIAFLYIALEGIPLASGKLKSTSSTANSIKIIPRGSNVYENTFRPIVHAKKNFDHARSGEDVGFKSQNKNILDHYHRRTNKLRQKELHRGRALEENEDEDDEKNGDEDDVNNVDDQYYEQAQGDDGGDDGGGDDDGTSDLCTQYLQDFLEGTTDAKDNCEGIQNAYGAAYCRDVKDPYDSGDDDHDDYFLNYNHYSCCQSLRNNYDTYCTESDLITNMHLLLIACVLLLCEMAKSLIKTHKLHFLPEAGGCILVGTLVGAIAHYAPGMTLDDVSFNEELFLCVLLPPIIFEAALSVNKKEFRRRRLAIAMFAVLGTILSTFMTGFMIHYASMYMNSCTTIPMLDSLIFGALISSIDPVAILSVLSSLKLTEEDTVFIMVFGESLLNDGVAITLFNSLVSHYDAESADTVNTDEILGAIADFLIVGFGSIAIGIICGFMSLIYFWFLRKKLNAPMEVASFFLWAGIPYYICDEAKLSGIVAIVTVGFFMDIYITTPKDKVLNVKSGIGQGLASSAHLAPSPAYEVNTHYIELGNSKPCNPNPIDLCGNPPNGNSSPSGRSIYSLRSLRSLKSLRTLNMRQLLFREEKFRLSSEADKHVRFVAHLLSQLSENCIFVYLGLFLFSKKYEWDVSLLGLSIISCVVSRSLMVVIICVLVWYINIFRQRCGCYKPMHHSFDSSEPQVSRTAAALQDRRIQCVLVLSGLRGAVSLSLVESIPIYNAVTGEGSEYKGEMKAMTSASIIFTVFLFGGSAYYILRRLDIQSIDKPHGGYNSRDASSRAKSTSGTRSLSRNPEHGHKPRPESPIPHRKIPPILIPSSKSLL